MGLKFDTGVDNKEPLDYISRNNNWKDNDTENGFKQGVVMCCSVVARKNTPNAAPNHTEFDAIGTRTDRIARSWASHRRPTAFGTM